MRVSSFSVSAALAMVLALGLALRIYSQSNGFHAVVTQSLATTEGYDQKFIDMVDHLEDVLTRRAGFAYPGGKDPMTGRRREVADPAAAEPSPRRPAVAQTRPNAAKTKVGGPKAPAKPDSAASEPAAAPVDKVKLTAIIADDYGQHTAIVMDGERSLSVDVGDMVGPRKVTKITSKEITMEDDTAIYGYDLAGTRAYQRK
jgi:hypothetical protein